MLSFHNNSKKIQRGSIMLEVIAVLALMGVMGAMLFRQIYQRNQELHNIQMASEMRTVKEAFSAYIQAQRAELITMCDAINITPNPCTNVSGNVSTFLAGDVNRGIRSYLPAGWFSDNNLQDYYTFSLWAYKQNDVTKKTILYGVIVPTQMTLPTTGWNFKRAARVALLIGADGGVYQDAMTGHNLIAGALGTWHLDLDDKMCDDSECPEPTYVAITSMDIFTPEYELPEGEVNLPEKWSLALEKAHAWNQFSAGADENQCHKILHTGYTSEDDKTVNSDSIYPTSCNPLFWVKKDGETAQVFVNNDLEIGNNGTANVTIRQEGPIVFNAKDQDNQANNEETSYVLDPAYTSTMNDIKIMSRGGAKLSDILPNYILKETKVGSCKVKINESGEYDSDETYYSESNSKKKTYSWCDLKWNDGSGDAMGHSLKDRLKCPKGYKYAVVVIPSQFGYLPTVLNKKEKHTHTIPLSGEHKHGEVDVNIGELKDGDGATIATGVTGKATISESGAHTHTVEDATTKFVSEISDCQFFVAMGQYSGVTKHVNSDSGLHSYDGTGSPLHVIMGYQKPSGEKCEVYDAKKKEETLKAIIQTYCVFDTSSTDSKSRKSDFSDWDTFKTKIKTQEECLSYGGTWASGTCS